MYANWSWACFGVLEPNNFKKITWKLEYDDLLNLALASQSHASCCFEVANLHKSKQPQLMDIIVKLLEKWIETK